MKQERRRTLQPSCVFVKICTLLDWCVFPERVRRGQKCQDEACNKALEFQCVQTFGSMQPCLHLCSFLVLVRPLSFHSVLHWRMFSPSFSRLPSSSECLFVHIVRQHVVIKPGVFRMQSAVWFCFVPSFPSGFEGCISVSKIFIQQLSDMSRQRPQQLSTLRVFIQHSVACANLFIHTFHSDS